MFFLKLSAEMASMMARLALETKIANGTKRVRSEELKMLWKCTAIARQMMLHKITMEYTQARMTLNTDGMPDDNLENKVRLTGWGGVRWPRV